jgi:hypothetical protein
MRNQRFLTFTPGWAVGWWFIPFAKNRNESPPPPTGRSGAEPWPSLEPGKAQGSLERLLGEVAKNYRPSAAAL